jgi:hypothetical protein
MNRAVRLSAAAATVTVAVLCAAACGGGSSSGEASGTPVLPTAIPSPAGLQSAVAAATGSASSHPASSASVRVANLYAPKGVAGPAVDIYDTQLTGAAVAPILTNVGYGTVSAYVHPKLVSTFGQKVVELFALPAGENPATPTANDDSKEIGGLIDDGSNAHMTIVLSADSGLPLGNGALNRLSDSDRMESGDDGQGGKGPAAAPPSAGTGELLVDQSVVPESGSTELYLMIDKSCAPPLNGDPNMKGVPFIFAADGVSPVSAFAVFATAPGRHQVSVVSWPSSTPPTCAQLTKRQSTMSVSVTGGQQVELYVYGSTLSHLHILAAPIQQ